ncbi:hypothetical protein HMPREF3034_01967 [Prevotella sp. DNF00663]|nr:hypothetical protein HMPREF3034_01967 [Prevotella sp. DNF00663]
MQKTMEYHTTFVTPKAAILKKKRRDTKKDKRTSTHVERYESG